MRLLKLDGGGEVSLEYFLVQDIPPYAILSHMWGADAEEVTYRDIVDGTALHKSGYWKIQFCAQQAARDGLSYFWIDSCCIDLSNFIEHSEAISSMFRWFRNATKCYVYLADVFHGSFPHNGGQPSFAEQSFRQSRWFTQCWALQDLLAPASAEFFAHDGLRLGDKESLGQRIHETTGIPLRALRGEPLSRFSIDERFSWAARRVSRREEDHAYSLLGIFDVFIPTIYGEGRENAFRRLRKEIGSWEAPQDPYRGLGEGRFRIIIINPATDGSRLTGCIAEHDFLECPEYNALSYTWGDEPPVHQIDLNYQPFYIPPNLFHALQRLRSTWQHVFLWVDFLCIDQRNEAEKSTQVQRMADIYQKANNVWIWLGEEGWKSKLAMTFIGQVNHHDFQWDSLWWTKDELMAFNHILERPWFRRRWVIQEAAYAANSTIFCGDCQVNMDDFLGAVRLVRQKLRDTPFSAGETNGYSDNFLSNFRDSPATRLLGIISAAFCRSAEGLVSTSSRQLSLETLVDLSSFCQTKKPQDAVFALLSLANDLKPPSQPHSSDSIVPDYSKNLLDVFAEFILHCCRSGSLDIICRPWTPILSAGTYTADEVTQFQEARMCSWLTSRDGLSFDNSSEEIAYRHHGMPLVGSSQKRIYNAHYGTMAQARLGRFETTNACDGSLYARGIVIGEVTRRSPRMANGVITHECLNILRTNPSDQQLSLTNLSDTVWRTLCADRNDKRHPAPSEYRSSIIKLLQLNQDTIPNGAHDVQGETVLNIDVEELSATRLAEDAKEVLKVIRDVTWNRRTFKGRRVNGDGNIVGLIPPYAKVGDQLCILYGCSIPVVLRKQERGNSQFHWQLVGEAYVHGIMDGEGMVSLSPAMLQCAEVEFEIR